MDSFKDGYFKAPVFAVESRRDLQGPTALPVSANGQGGIKDVVDVTLEQSMRKARAESGMLAMSSATSPRAGSRRNSVPANATHPLFAFFGDGSMRGSEASAALMEKAAGGADTAEHGRRASKSCPGKEWNFDGVGRLSEPTPGAEWDF
jgi:hypothetical protein